MTLSDSECANLSTSLKIKRYSCSSKMFPILKLFTLISINIILLMLSDDVVWKAFSIDQKCLENFLEYI